MMDDSDCLIECPYNKSHRVQKSRMQTHLCKCRKSYPTVELKRCPYNANHDIAPAEFEMHKETCPDRGMVETHVAQTAAERTSVVGVYVAPTLPSDNENWESDEPVKTYDPVSKNLNAKVLRSLQGASKSERRSHRAQERLRFNAVSENGGLGDAPGGSGTSSGSSPPECTSANNAGPPPEPRRVTNAFAYDEEIRPPRTRAKTAAMLPLGAMDAKKSRGADELKGKNGTGDQEGPCALGNGKANGSPPGGTV